MHKIYRYTMVNRKKKFKESAVGSIVDLQNVLGSDIVYFMRFLERENNLINVAITTENFEIVINSN